MKQRIEYIDAARGLAIFTVVYSHICLFCIPDYHASSALIDFLRMYFLNGFFFISGILAHGTVCSKTNAMSLLWKRAYQLLFPAIVVGLIFSISHHTSVKDFFFSDSKCGFWFTVSLFEMYVIYYLYSLLVNRFMNKNISAVIFVLLCFIFYFAFKIRPLPIPLNNLLCWGNTVFYISFFSLGLLFSQYKNLIISKIPIGGG